MIRKIKEYVIYKSQVKALKRYVVASITDFVANNEDYLNGIRKILLSVKDEENIDNVQDKFITALAEIVHSINTGEETQVDDSENLSEETE